MKTPMILSVATLALLSSLLSVQAAEQPLPQTEQACPKISHQTIQDLVHQGVLKEDPMTGEYEINVEVLRALKKEGRFKESDIAGEGRICEGV
ncbi:hypothetical protein WDW37_13205 [Bdellovibrionota bacterium FG-1]